MQDETQTSSTQQQVFMVSKEETLVLDSSSATTTSMMTTTSTTPSSAGIIPNSASTTLSNDSTPPSESIPALVVNDSSHHHHHDENFKTTSIPTTTSTAVGVVSSIHEEKEESQPSLLQQPSNPRRPISHDHSSHQASSSQPTSLVRRESLAARMLSRFQKKKQVSTTTTTDQTTSAHQDVAADDSPSNPPHDVVFKIPVSSSSEKKKLSKKSSALSISSHTQPSSVNQQESNSSSINMNTIQDYIFHFHRIFTDKNMFKAFYNYLETEHNTEPLEFVQQVNELEMDYYKLMRVIKSLTSSGSNNSGGGMNSSGSSSSNNLTQASSVQSLILSFFGKNKDSTHFQSASQKSPLLGSPTMNQGESRTARAQNSTSSLDQSGDLSEVSSSNPAPSLPRLSLKLSALTKKEDEISDTCSNLVNSSVTPQESTAAIDDTQNSSSPIPHQQNDSHGQEQRNANSEEVTPSALSRMALPMNTPRSKQESINSMKRKIIMSAIKIMKEFIEEDSKKEINISSRDKTTYVNLFWQYKQYQNFDEWVLPQLPHLLFRTVKNSVLFELENDSFPRFVRSELWLKCVQQQGVTYLNKIGRLKEATYFPYTDDDFKLPMVFDRDIEFMEYLARDDYNWKLIGSTKEPSINVYKISGKMLFPNVGIYQKMQTNKWWGILPHPFDVSSNQMSLLRLLTLDLCDSQIDCLIFTNKAVRQCCMPGFHVHRYDPNITSCDELAYYDFEALKKMYPNEKFKRGKRSVSIIRYGVCFPFPFKTKRSFLSACTSYYDKNEQKLTLLYKPCEHERFYKDGKNVNEGKKLIDIRDFQFYQIKKLDSHRTIISQIHLLDVGGNARPAINMLRMDRAKGMMKGFNEYIRKHINGQIPEISPEDPVWKTVVECMGKEEAHKLDLSATLYNDLTSGRNISNKSLDLDLMVPSSNNTASESSQSTLTTTRGDHSSTIMSPEMIIQEEEEAMLTAFDADLENFTMTGTDKDESDDEEDGDENDEEDEMVQ
ncbi:hypothetical protein C9374_000373 [Naegleria lovaniensis]|uniref:RGS domain-containing protein n=1 Tax=Naegleria lovaniensis TaxID=51637 RepID=A0AA88G514_NAELO|nr:uncharacterized protein C9374_000373 [Naegleria lovaniensis]KAG2370583.1 hypothetical protein C9374_000373 [Naegleria lovaniensis]